jgi:hypothetical protein
MKLCKSNVFVNKILVKDPEPELDVFCYQGDIGITRVLVSGLPEVTTHSGDDHFLVRPLRFESEKQFNSLAIDALLKACNINGNITTSMEKGCRHFITREFPMGHVLVSKELEADNSQFLKGLQKHLNSRLIVVGGLNENQLILTAAPDLLGAVAINGDDLDKYGIAIVNSQAVMLVELP